jgi:hypothetical protein
MMNFKVKDEQGHINFDGFRQAVQSWFVDNFAKLSADTLGWFAAILIHLATIPTLVATAAGLSDRMPPVDMVLFMWGGLLLLFARATILKDGLNIITIGLGFAIQAILMALMIFK